MGDFNLPKINWHGQWSGDYNNEFLESLRDSYLSQMVNKPTRCREGQTPNVLDLIIVNDELMISDIDHICPVGNSDHETLFFNLYIQYKARVENDYKYNFKLGNFNAMREEMGSINWLFLNESNVNDCWNAIKEQLLSCMDKYIPKVKKGGRQAKPLWMNNKTMKAIKKKYAFYKRYLNTRDGLDYQRHIKMRNKSNRLVKMSKKEYEKSIAKNCKSNNKIFWKYVNFKLKTNVGVSTLISNTGNIAVNDHDKANVLNSYFSSVFTDEDLESIPTLDEAEKSNGIQLTDILITPEAVRVKLMGLDINKAYGPDGIPPRVLKELKNELFSPMYIV